MAAHKKQSRKKWVIIIVCIIVVLFVIYALFFPSKAAQYKEMAARNQNITTYYSFSGNIESKHDTITYSSTNDKVKKIYAKTGETVKENDLLLTTEGGVKYKANIDGVLASFSVDEKDSFLSGTELYHISDFLAPQVVIKVDEYDVEALSVGMPVDVYVHPLSKTVQGTISEISLEATVTDNISFYEAFIDVEQDGSLRMGMSCEATLVKDQVENAVALSIEAIQYDENYSPFVYIPGRKQNEALKQAVVLGINDGIYVEIKSGLAANATVLIPYKNNLYMMPMGPSAMGGN